MNLMFLRLFPPLLVITCDYLCQHFCFKTYPIALPALIHTLYMYLYQDECSPSAVSFYLFIYTRLADFQQGMRSLQLGAKKHELLQHQIDCITSDYIYCLSFYLKLAFMIRLFFDLTKWKITKNRLHTKWHCFNTVLGRKYV